MRPVTPNQAEVTVIIPNWNGEWMLRRCLASLRKTEYLSFQTLVVDNASTDSSVSMMQTEFPEVRFCLSETNLGYAGGCNLGVRRSSSPFVVFLNNDAEVNPGWLGPLMEVMKDEKAAAVQPKVHSIKDRNRFDYCGAAGGEMDIFGYPFARGRLFHVMETDEGQYDSARSIFWATGAVCLLRRSALDRVGLLDDTFFAHMEEIDLCWRLHLAGYAVRAATDSVVYHQTGGTLDQESLRKMVLNHRNSLIMICKNYQWQTISWVLPIRILLEIMTFFGFLMKGQPRRSLAVILGFSGALGMWRSVLNGRENVKRLRKQSDSAILSRLYHGSVALDFFMLGIRKASQLRLPRYE